MKKLKLFVLVLLASLGACTIKSPVLPQWDITLNLPLINQKYYVKDLVDSVNIMVGDDDVMYLHSEGEISTAEFGDVAFSPQINTPSIPVLSGHVASDSFPLVDDESGFSISYGELSAGSIKVNFSDINPATQSIQITFVELLNPDLSPFQIAYEGSEGWSELDLAGCYLGTMSSGALVEELSFSISSSSSLPNNSYLGDIQILIDSPMQFSLFEGYLPNYILNLQDNDVELEISYPMGIESAIQLMEASLLINVTNRIGFECEFEGNLYAVNNTTGESRTIPVIDENGANYLIAPASQGQAQDTQINLTNNIESILSIMPDQFQFRDAFFRIHSLNQAIGQVRNTDYIDGIYTINAPFHFILNSSRIIVKDEVEIEISKENQDRIRRNAIFAALAIEFKNNLPFGALAELYFGVEPEIDVDDPATYAFSRSVEFHSVEVDEGQISVDMELTKNELDVFANPKVYMRWAFTFDDTITPIYITASPLDYIQIRSMMNAKLHIEEGK